MLLAIDVGNTQTVLGVYDGEHLVHMWRVATNVDHTSDELRIKLHVLMEAEGVDPKCIDGAILASVVPALTHNWEKACYRSFCVQLLVISARTVGHLINMDQEKFAELGADRVADAAAAKCLYGSPVIVVDFGTATNIEIIDKTGTFVGGIIAPGVDSSMRSLLSRAALLRSVELEDPGTAIGTPPMRSRLAWCTARPLVSTAWSSAFSISWATRPGWWQPVAWRTASPPHRSTSPKSTLNSLCRVCV